MGREKQNRLVADLGRFWGWATISPWRVKIRHTVERDGTGHLIALQRPHDRLRPMIKALLKQLFALTQHGFLDRGWGLTR